MKTKPTKNTLNQLELSDLIPLETLQKLQDGFADSYNIPSSIIRQDGSPITNPSRFTEFCKFVRTSKKGLANCEKFDTDLMKVLSEKRKPYIRKGCTLKNIITGHAPIIIEGKHVASLSIGQFVEDDFDFEEIKNYAKEIEVDEKKLIEAAKTLISNENRDFQSALQFINTLAQTIGNLAEGKLELKRILTKNKSTEKKLKENNEHFQEVVSNITSIVWRADIDTDGSFINTYISPVADEILELSLGTINNSWEKYISYVKAQYLEPIDKAFKDGIITPGAVISLEYEVVKESGQTAWFYSTGRCFNRDGSLHIFGSTIDITEKKKSERALSESERKREIWIENSPVCTKIVDPDFNLLYMSSSGIRELKIDNIQEFYDKPYPFNFYPDSFKIPMLENMKEVKETGTTITQEASVLDVEGNELWYQSSIVPVSDENGKLDYLLIVSLETTERKEAEEILQESEEKYREVVERAHDGIFIIQDDIVKFSNAKLAELYGGDLDDIIGTSFRNFVHPDELPRIEKIYRDRMANKQVSSIYETVLVNINGEQVDAEVSAGLISYEGKPADLVIVRDITERKKAEETLQESEEKYREVVERAHDGIFIIQDDIVKFSNAKLAELYGGDLDDIIGTSFRNFVHPDELPRIEKIYRDRMANKQVSSIYETVLVNINGEQVDAEVSAGLISYEGKPADLVIVRDITERKKAEQALKESEEKFSKAFNLNPNTIAIIDLETKRRLAVNDYFAKIVGHSKETLMENPLGALGEIDKEKVERVIETIKKGGSLSNVEVKVKHKNGSERLMLYAAESITIGDRSCMIASGKDITERKKIEQELKESETRFKALHNASFGGIAIHDKGIILECNLGLTEITGFSTHELINTDGLRLIAEESRDMVMEKILGKYEKQYEAIGIRKNAGQTHEKESQYFRQPELS
ncbi:MAG: PAS domain S-box protein, partial [Bacteroidetes bacterium]|nr:PAS domain S-box protein [Bacteroidota bacterium]